MAHRHSFLSWACWAKSCNFCILLILAAFLSSARTAAAFSTLPLKLSHTRSSQSAVQGHVVVVVSPGPSSTADRFCFGELIQHDRASFTTRMIAPMKMTADDNENESKENNAAAASSSRRKRRVRRKDASAAAAAASASAALTSEQAGKADSQPQPQTMAEESTATTGMKKKGRAVEMQVRDIRDVVSGRDDNAMTTTTAATQTRSNVNRKFDEDEDERDPFAVKRYTGNEDGEMSLNYRVQAVIGNIVVADFFIVLALLFWFLAGIFCSSVLKDDTVQLAFNGIFEPIVQPALGILMIAAVASGLLGDKTQEERY